MPTLVGPGARHWRRLARATAVSQIESLLPAPLVPGMRIAGHLDAQRVDRCVCATEQRAQVRPAEREVDGLLRPSNDADAPTVGRHDPDAARPRAINAAEAVHLHAIRYTRLSALV